MANFNGMNVTFNPNFNASIQMQPAPVVNLQESKTATPTKDTQRIAPDAEYDGLRAVIINPIPDRYIEPDKTIKITQNGTHNVTDAKEAIVDVPVPPEYIIPNGTKEITENGTVDIAEFKSANVNVPIPNGYIKPEGSMPITENGTFDVTEKAEVNVQVVAKPEKPYIDSSKLKTGGSMFSSTYGTDLSLLENFDGSGLVSTNGFCNGRTDLTDFPPMNIPNSTDGTNMFLNCSNLTGKVKLESPKIKTFIQAFQGCTKVREVDIKTDSCAIFSNTFNNCNSVEIITLSETALVSNWTATFNRNLKLHTINGELTMQNTNYCSTMLNGCGALKNVRYKYIGVTSSGLSFAGCGNLTVDSLLSILNALSDNTGLDTTYTVYLGSANLEKLTDEQKEIAYNKNIFLA